MPAIRPGASQLHGREHTRTSVRSKRCRQIFYCVRLDGLGCSMEYYGSPLLTQCVWGAAHLYGAEQTIGLRTLARWSIFALR